MCETEELAELTQALLTVGMMLGSLLGPSLSGIQNMDDRMSVTFLLISL